MALMAFCLNRLLDKIHGGIVSIVDDIPETDSVGCNTVMHAANENTS